MLNLSKWQQDKWVVVHTFLAKLFGRNHTLRTLFVQIYVCHYCYQLERRVHDVHSLGSNVMIQE